MKSCDKFKYGKTIYTLQKLPDFDLWILIGECKDLQGNIHYVHWKGIDNESTTPIGAFGRCFQNFEAI